MTISNIEQLQFLRSGAQAIVGKEIEESNNIVQDTNINTNVNEENVDASNRFTAINQHVHSSNNKVDEESTSSSTNSLRSSIDANDIQQQIISRLPSNSVARFAEQSVSIRSLIEKEELPFTKKRECPNNCFGRGECDDGLCHCIDGYGGSDCSTATCL